MKSLLQARWRAALFATCALASPAYAQAPAAPPPSDPQSDEVVVTARKREERLSDVPATIAVIGSEKLESLSVTNANELNGVVPGLVMASGVGGLPAVTFRGLGSNSALFSVEASVALFVDGVYSAHTRDFVTPLYDIDRIEMVKGTQGTLLGKNTTLGAVAMVTRRPGDVFGFSAQTSYDIETETTRLEGAVDMPLSDTLKVRLAGLWIDDGGYVDNALTGSEPQTEDMSGRLGVSWTPSDTFDLTFSYQHDEHDQTGQSLEVVRDASAGATLAARAAATGQTNFEGLGNRRSAIGSLAFSTTAPAGPTPFDEQTSNRANLIMNVYAGNHTFTSQTSYVNWLVERLSDLDFLQANLFNLGDNEKNLQYAQEFRVASSGDGRVSYLLGAFFFHNDWSLNRTLYGYAPSPLFGFVQSLFRQKTDTVSIFGQTNIALTDALKANLGLRYTEEQKDGRFFRAPGTGSIGAAFPAYALTTIENSESDLDGDIGLQYTLEPGRMIYASASRGSKGGGFQNAPTTLAGAPYTGETALTYEVGGKFVFDRGSLDVAVFQTTVEDFQFSRTAAVGTPAVSQTVVTNVDVRSQGVELNGALRPFDNLRLSGGIVYADSVFTETVPPAPAIPVTLDGLQQPRAPKWSGTFDANLTLPVTDNLTVSALGSLEFMSRTYYQPNVGVNLNAPFRDDFTKVNLRVALENESGGWEIALLGKNLTDVTEPQFVTSVSGTGAGPTTNTPAWYGIMNPPRTFVIQFKISR